MDCDNKITHFFPLDLEPEKRNWNLHDVNKITINPVVIMNIMEKLEQWPVDQTEFQPYCQRIVLNHWQSQSQPSGKPALTSDRTQLDSRELWSFQVLRREVRNQTQQPGYQSAILNNYPWCLSLCEGYINKSPGTTWIYRKPSVWLSETSILPGSIIKVLW